MPDKTRSKSGFVVNNLPELLRANSRMKASPALCVWSPRLGKLLIAAFYPW